MDTSRDMERVADALAFLAEKAEDQPSLDDLADYLGLSKYHLHRVFRRWAGITPKQFLEYLTVERAKERLRECESVLEAAWSAGLSGPSRLHDHFVAVEATTPGEFRSGGEGLELRYGLAGTPFGPAGLAWTPRGVSRLSFDMTDASAWRRELRREWPRADLVADDDGAVDLAERIFDAEGSRPPLDVRGTNFQIRVWRALLEVPEGAVTSYGAVARAVGSPNAARAVGAAVKANPVAWLIPCHRVIRAVGELGGYRWDPDRKAALLAREWAAAGV